MTLEALANLGEFIGGIVVIFSLAYLAVQIRQSTQAQRTENYSRALERVDAMQSQCAVDPVFSRLISAGTADPQRLTPMERIQLTWALYQYFGAMEFMFHAMKSNTLPEEIWDRWSETARWWLSFPGVQAWWRALPVPFSRSFTEYLEAMLADAPPDAEQQARWQGFVAGTDLTE